MANRTIKDGGMLGVNGTSVFNSASIPAGQEAVLQRMLLTDSSVADNKSVSFTVEWGTAGSFNILSIFHSNGQTLVIPVEETIVGDGNKFIKITMKNPSQLSRFAAWRLDIVDSV